MNLVIESKAVRQYLHDGLNAQAIGFAILDQARAEIREEDGDSADNNAALRIFETALDWRLGILAVGLLEQAVKRGVHLRLPIRIARNGDIIATKSGKKVA